MPNLEAIAEHFRFQGRVCTGMGSPFTGDLCAAMAEDIEAGGPVAALVGTRSGDPREDALALRLAGALHCAAVDGLDAALADYYTRAGDGFGPEVWRVARAFLEREHAWAAEFIESAPQTNETGRSIALLAGFCAVALRFGLPLDLLELGASAGLNLNWDRFGYRTEGWAWQPENAPLVEPEWWRGPSPLVAVPQVRHRRGCDLNPIDPTDADACRRFRAYIWPDQPARLRRFDAALEHAVASPVRVERADAGAWIEERLAECQPGAATVVYHSIFLQYPPPETRARIERAIRSAGARATHEAPLAWLRFELEPVLEGGGDSVRTRVDLITWPGGEHRVLSHADPHGRFIDARPEVLG